MKIVDSFNLELLRNFLVVSQMQSFSKASAYLYVDQSTISKQIKQPENQFDITLFVRTAKGVKLTAAGQTFARQARQILDAYHQLGAKTKVDWEQLRIEIFDNIAVSYCLPLLIEHFSDLREVKISNEGRALISIFNRGLLDAIIINGALEDSIKGQYVSQQVATEEMMVMAGSKCRLDFGRQMKMGDLKNQKILIAPEYCPVSQEINRSADLFSGLHRIDYTEAMIQLVAHSSYLTILPAGMVKQLCANNKGLKEAVLTDLPQRKVTIFAREKRILEKIDKAL